MPRASHALYVTTMGAALLLTMCGGGETPSGSGSGGGLTIGPGSGGTGNASSPSSGGTGGTGEASSSSGPCVEAWSCTPWDGKGTDDATRTCTDIHKCGTTTGKPIEAATLPSLDKNYFRCNVTPILDAKCSQLGCHGTETGRPLRFYARARLRPKGVPLVAPKPPYCNHADPSDGKDCIGKMLCECLGPHVPTETQRNFDAARGFGLDDQGAPIPSGNEEASDLIAQPVVGGKSHAGVHLFKANDPEFTTIKNWLSGATLGSCTPLFD